MSEKLSPELQQAVDAHDGCLSVPAGDRNYVVMSMKLFRDMLGVGTEEELQQSLQSIDRGQADVAAGRTRPFRDVLAELA
jgi:hypothetical protein